MLLDGTFDVPAEQLQAVADALKEYLGNAPPNLKADIKKMLAEDDPSLAAEALIKKHGGKVDRASRPMMEFMQYLMSMVGGPAPHPFPAGLLSVFCPIFMPYDTEQLPEVEYSPMKVMVLILGLVILMMFPLPVMKAIESMSLFLGVVVAAGFYLALAGTLVGKSR